MKPWRFTLRTIEPRHFGTGWISGVLAAALGAIGFGAVVCFHFPSLFTVPELRALYPLPYIRALLHLVLVAAFVLGTISVTLRQNKALGVSAIAFALAAALLGGSQVPVGAAAGSGPFLGLDWFLLSLMLYSATFVPLERLFALRPEQDVFRPGWRTDLAYFGISALLLQLTTLLTLRPAMVLFDWAASADVQAWVSGQPRLVQFVEILVLTDVCQYWIHRAFHRVPLLWRFHEIHHSAETMDWIAGARLHLVDVAATRGLTYVPIYVLGFDPAALVAYVVFVSVQATFIHANVRFEFGRLAWVVATPRFHHWHHGIEPEAVDKNFAIHLPLLDWLFGTFHLPPGQWPAGYGVQSERPVPDGFLRQLVHPFGRRPPTGS
jgi:sterol desaturase/sphingolipid hydroxylase (fatty acid hydroxylase superfamily)